MNKQRSVLPIQFAWHPGQFNSYTIELWYVLGVGSFSDIKQLVSVVFQFTINLQGATSRGLIFRMRE